MSEEQTPGFWDAQAPTFDTEADHGLTDAYVRVAWRSLFTSMLCSPPATVAEVGCGTGSFAVLLAEMGYQSSGFDFAPRMVELARTKALRHGVNVAFSVADASTPPLNPESVDAVVARHVLWALPEPEQAVARWRCALKPGGRLLLIEGFWSTGVGLRGDDLLTMVRRHIGAVEIHRLTESALWGRPIDDERYAILART